MKITSKGYLSCRIPANRFGIKCVGDIHARFRSTMHFEHMGFKESNYQIVHVHDVFVDN